MNINEKKRSDAIDMVKGLSIMTLFFLHFENGCLNTDLNFFIVRSPAFYLVVGWLWGMSSNRRTIKEHWEKRKKGLVIPYLCFSLIFIILDLILLAVSWIEPFVLYRDIYKTLCLRGIGTLWFLPALLGGEMMFILLRDSKAIKKILLLSTSVLLLFMYNAWTESSFYTHSNLANIIDAPLKVIKEICNAILYITIAYYISHFYGKEIFNSNRIILFSLGLIMLPYAFYIANYCQHFDFYLNFIFFIIFNVFAGIGILLFFRSIEKYHFFTRPLVYCGKNSLIIMTIHWGLFLIALCIDKYLLNNDSYEGCRTIAYFLIATIILIGIIELINRKLRFIIGK